MSLFNIFNVSGSAMSAQAQRLNVVASNLANADSATSASGEAYRARQVVFEPDAHRWRHCHRRARQAGGGRPVADEDDVRPETSCRRRKRLRDHAQRECGGRDGQHAVGLAFYQTNVETMNAAKTLLLKTLTIGPN
jgi:flagellar basal-body rod protein FlgC